MRTHPERTFRDPNPIILVQPPIAHEPDRIRCVDPQNFVERAGRFRLKDGHRAADQVHERARVASGRIDKGIALLDDPVCLEAFRLTNKVMAAAARRRFGVMQGKPAESVEPAWRPFQLAFVLMNLPGISDATQDDREVVDLLFFPTGGGKTESVSWLGGIHAVAAPTA